MSKSLGFFILLGLVFAWPWWIRGWCLYPGSNLGDFPLHFDGVTQARNYDLLDSIAQEYPSQRLFQKELREGHLPLWNPYPMMGVPLYQGQANYYFYPPLLALHLLVSVERVHDLLVISHLALAGWGMHFFLRGLGHSGRACLWGGLVWAWNGYLTTNLQFQSLLICLSWFPILLGLVQRQRWWTAVLVAGLGVGAGPLNVVWIGWGVAFLWGVYLHGRVAPVAASLTGGALLTCAQTLPTFSILSQSLRSAGDSGLQVANCQKFLTQVLLGFWVPDAWGNPALGFHLQRLDGGQWFYFETCCYLGIAPGALAVLGLLRRPQGHLRFWLALLALQVICLATPLFFLLSHLPLVGGIASLRTLPFSMLVLTLLSVTGFEEIEQSGYRLCRLGLGLTLALAVAIGLWLNSPHTQMVRIPFPERGPEAAKMQSTAFWRWQNPGFWLPLAQLAGLTVLAWLPLKPARRVVLLFGLASCDLVRFAACYNPWDDPARLGWQNSAVDVLQAASYRQRVLGLGTLRPNVASAFEIRELSGYGSLLPARQSLLLSGLRQDPPRFEPLPVQVFPLRGFDPLLLNLLSVSHLATYPGDPAPVGWDLVDRAQIPIYRNPHPQPLARFAPDARVRSSPDFGSEFRHWLEAPHQPFIAASDARPMGPGGTCRIDDWSAGRLSVDIGPEAWGWLVLGEGYFRDWRARIDGVEVPIYPANLAQMAVYVPAGSRRVELFFWPAGLSLGLTLAGLTLCASLIQLARGQR